MSVLDALLARDPKQRSRKLCVVTCCDPEIPGLLERALQEAEPMVILALPGPAVRSGSDELPKAVASALVLQGCDEVLVVAHTGCSLVGTQAGEVAGRLSSRGFDRARLPEDVRSFFNLQASPRQIAVGTAAAIRSAPFMPAGLLVHAALLDSGTLTLLEHGENAASATHRPPQGIFGEAGPSVLAGGLPEGLGVGLAPSPASPSGPVSLDDLPAPGARSEAPIPPPPAPLPTSLVDLRPPELAFRPSSFDFRLTELASGPSVTLEASAIDLRPLVDAAPAAPAVKPPPLAAASASRAPAPSRAPPRAAPPRPGNRPPPRAQARPVEGAAARPAARIPAEIAQPLEKVRDFYRMELNPGVRAEVARALREAFGAGAANPELIKTAFRPVLESGPKRYKVIDELLAIKEAATAMERDGCYAALRQLVE